MKEITREMTLRITTITKVSDDAEEARLNEMMADPDYLKRLYDVDDIQIINSKVFTMDKPAKKKKAKKE